MHSITHALEPISQRLLSKGVRRKAHSPAVPALIEHFEGRLLCSVDAIVSQTADQAEADDLAELRSSLSYDDLRHIYDLEEQYGFTFSRSYYINEFGYADKALYGRDSQWYQIRPGSTPETAELWKSAGTCTFVAELHRAAYDEPRLLFEARLPALEELPKEAVDEVFAEIASGTLGISDAPESASPETSTDPALFEASRLQEKYGFYTSGNLYENDIEPGTKWFQASKEDIDQWYVMDRNFAVFKFIGRSIGESIKVGQLDARYSDLGLLFGALDMSTEARARAMKSAAAEEIETPLPSFSITAFGSHALKIGYRNVQREGMRIVIVPHGDDPTWGNHFEAALSLGDGSMTFYVPGGSVEARADIVFLDHGGREIGQRQSFWFWDHRITEHAFSVEENPIETMGSISEPAFRLAFSNKVFELVKSVLPPLLARDDDTGGAAEGLQHGYMMIGAMANEAFQALLKERLGKGRVAISEIGLAGIRMRDDYVRSALQYVLNLPSAGDILRIVTEHFDTICALQQGQLARQSDFYRRGAEAAGFSAPVSLPTVSRLQSLNATALSIAWSDMTERIDTFSSDVRDQFESALAHAGFDTVQIVASGALVTSEQTVTKAAQDQGVDIIIGDRIADAAAELGFSGVSIVPEAIVAEEPLHFGDGIRDALRRFIAHHPEFWYSTSVSVPSSPDVFVRSDTTIGLLYRGLSQQLWSVKDASLAQAIASRAEAMTGISASSLLSVDRAMPSSFARGMQRLFTDHGFEHLFSRDPVRVSAEAGVLHPRVDGHIFVNGEMRLHWDTALAGKSISHTRVYLVDNMSTLHQASETPFLEMTGDTAVASIPVESIGMNGENIGFKVAVWFTDGTHTGGFIENPFVVGWDGSSSDIVTSENLSTAPEGTEQWYIENAILQRLHLPVDASYGEWTNNLESEYHDGTEYFAVDLNISGNSDFGVAVSAATDGKIVQWNEKKGFLQIEHKANVIINSQTKEITWYTEYRHMNGILIPSDAAHAVISGQMEIGTIGEEGEANGPHLHFVVRYDGIAIDTSNLLRLHSIEDRNERAPDTASYSL